MGKLRVDLSELHRCVEEMGAREVDFSLSLSMPPLEPIVPRLREDGESPGDPAEGDSR